MKKDSWVYQQGRELKKGKNVRLLVKKSINMRGDFCT